jgi:hypothetical protein
MQNVEAEVVAIRSTLSRLELTQSPSRSDAVAEPTSTRQRILAISVTIIVLVSLGLICSYWLLGAGDIYLFLSILFPAFGGFAAGLFIAGRHVKLYALQGFIIGLVSRIGIARDLLHYSLIWAFLLGVLLSMVLTLILFLLSAILANWLKRRFLHEPILKSRGSRLAVALARVGSAPGADLSKGIEFWKGMLGALTPVLTLIGTIVTG